MRTGHASRTAEHNALFRALETMRSGDRLFDDALARRFLTGSLALVGRLALAPGASSAVRWFIDRRWPGVRTSVVARTALIDDVVEARRRGASSSPSTATGSRAMVIRRPPPCSRRS